MSKEMDYSEAAMKLAECIQNEEYSESGGLMIQVFCDAIKDEETPRMALAMAKNPLNEIGQLEAQY